MSIFTACILSFLTVFILLGFLSLLIRMVISLFPPEKGEDDAAVMAVIHSAVAATFPEARVSRIEEIRK